MTQKHKRPTAPASKKLPPKKAAAHSAKEKAAHAAKPAHAAAPKDKAKHVEPKKPLVKGKAPEKAAPVADAKGKVVDLKPAQKLAAARAQAAAAAATAAPADGKKGKKSNAELINLPARRNVLPEERQSQLKLLIARGKEQGYLTYSQVNDHLPSEIVDPEQIEEIVNTINDMGIPVYEKAPDNESILAPEPSAPTDEEAIEEAAQALTAQVAGNIGFDGLLVALLGRNRPWGTLLAAILFGALRAGGNRMQSFSGISLELVTVLQALIVIFIAAPALVKAIFHLRAARSARLGTSMAKCW